MDIQLNDILVMKKTHPCGEKRWKVLRTGADFRLRCLGCGHENDCGIHGCAVMRAAADAMENLQTENSALHQIAEKQAVMNVNMTKKALEMEA